MIATCVGCHTIITFPASCCCCKYLNENEVLSSFFNFSECNEFNFFMKVYEILRDLSLVTSLLFRSFLAIRTQIELISLILTPYSTLLVMALTNFVLFGEKVALLYSTRLNHTGRANCWTKEMVLIHFVLLVKKCWTFYTQHD